MVRRRDNETSRTFVLRKTKCSIRPEAVRYSCTFEDPHSFKEKMDVQSMIPFPRRPGTYLLREVTAGVAGTVSSYETPPHSHYTERQQPRCPRRRLHPNVQSVPRYSSVSRVSGNTSGECIPPSSHRPAGAYIQVGTMCPSVRCCPVCSAAHAMHNPYRSPDQ